MHRPVRGLDGVDRYCDVRIRDSISSDIAAAFIGTAS